MSQPNNPVSKSLNSLAMQEKEGNYEVVNTAVDKVAKGVVDGGNDVGQVVKTAAAEVTTVDGGTIDGQTLATTDGTTSLYGGSPPADTDSADGGVAALDTGTDSVGDGDNTGDGDSDGG